MTRVVVLDDWQGRASEFGPWEALGAGVSVEFIRRHVEGDELAGVLEGADVVVAMRERTQLDRQLISSLDALKLLVTTGMGNVAIDVAAAAERGIPLCGTRGSSTSVPELAWALIFAMTKRIVREDQVIRAGGWQESIPRDLTGATLALAGLGRQGSMMLPIARALQMNVIAWSQNLDPTHARELGVEPVARDFLLEHADVLSIHLRLSERTRGLFGGEELARLKPTAVLVNTSRGPIVDEQSLLEVLRDRRIAGAGLDVFDQEPLPADHPFLELDNVVLSPHLGYVSEASYSTYFTEIVEDITAFLGGSPIRVVASS